MVKKKSKDTPPNIQDEKDIRELRKEAKKRKPTSIQKKIIRKRLGD